MISKSTAVLFLVVAACLAAPSPDSEGPNFQFHEISKDTGMGNTVDRYRRAPADGVPEEGKECMKNGRKATCVLYFQCADASSADDDKGCENYLQTCCISKGTDLVNIVDIQ